MKLGKFGSFAAAVAAALCSTIAVGAVIDAKPDHFVEWLGSDGNQQIDTGYVFKTDPRVETTMMLLSDGDKDVAGMPGTSATCFIVDYKDSAKLIYYRYGATGSTNVTYPESIVDSWVDVVWGKTVSHNGVELATMPDKVFSSNTAKFFIFYARSGMPGVRFKEFKMFDGNELVRDFKPAVMEDGTACMYDTVTQKCYTNNKTGTFSVGPAVYDKDFYDITIAEAEHGSVTASPAPYAAGSKFTATAQADDGYAFAGWEGVPATRAHDNPLTLSVNRDYAIVPRFGKITYVEWLGSTAGGGEYIDTGYVIKSAPTLETTMMVKSVSYGNDAVGTPKNTVACCSPCFHFVFDSVGLVSQ